MVEVSQTRHAAGEVCSYEAVSRYDVYAAGALSGVRVLGAAGDDERAWREVSPVTL